MRKSFDMEIRNMIPNRIVETAMDAVTTAVQITMTDIYVEFSSGYGASHENQGSAHAEAIRQFKERYPYRRLGSFYHNGNVRNMIFKKR